ncbi:hypothetical protein GCM10011374_28550 [Kocuria dechangensis]|uniref:PepSY domain-containing protein n=1 Tax=Kocuria dechangensis TaxID=1176249 RepID=A0A917H0D6_9MICC|nr:PepSY domain-containing protein [Kocuria dechangensis]GGG63438.1 hypothetical protein GCM10011374_28550 [Kocuria dechangensis]
MKHTDHKRATLSALAVSVLLLAGCGDGGGTGGEEPTDGAGTSAPAEPTATGDETGDATATPSGTASPDDDESATPSGTATADDDESATATPSGTAGAAREADTLAAAVATAEEAVGGDAQAFELGREDSPASWETSVASGEREHEVYVSEDGAEVISQEEGELDADDRERLGRVQVPLEDALRTALGTVGGTLDEAQLDTEDGVTVWEIDIDEPDGNSVDVYVNVEDGSVLKIDR